MICAVCGTATVITLTVQISDECISVVAVGKSSEMPALPIGGQSWPVDNLLQPFLNIFTKHVLYFFIAELFVTSGICVPKAGHIPEQDQAFTFRQEGKRELQ